MSPGRTRSTASSPPRSNSAGALSDSSTNGSRVPLRRRPHRSVRGDQFGVAQDRVAQPQIVAARDAHSRVEQVRVPARACRSTPSAPKPSARSLRSSRRRSAGTQRSPVELLAVRAQEGGDDAGHPPGRGRSSSRGQPCPPSRSRRKLSRRSMDSLAAASARLFERRGTHSNETSRPSMSALARLASTCMSGCLIFHRPVICSTTSFESSRTWTDAEGSRSQRGLQARDQAVVLGDVVARDADVDSDLAQHVAGGVIEDDRSAGGDSGVAARAPVGFDDQPAGHRPDSSVRTRMHPHSGQVITASSAARRTLCISVPARTIRQPSHVPRRSSAAPELRAATRS